MNSLTPISFSLLGGVLPALLWLWFWLKEDRLHPEPKSLISVVFLGGMASVFLVLPLEKLVYNYNFSSITFITLILWASIEEVVKYGAAYFTALRNKEMDEPIDAVIYLITAALGFSALENTLFIFNLVNEGSMAQSIITGNSRFLGATLLHVASSAVIGIFIGLAYYKSFKVKALATLCGIAISVTLHTIFNLLIIKLENDRFLVFTGVWVLIVVLIVLIEKVKKIYPRNLLN